MRSGTRKEGGEEGGEGEARKEARSAATNIKSNNPHLAGGEKTHVVVIRINILVTHSIEGNIYRKPTVCPQPWGFPVNQISSTYSGTGTSASETPSQQHGEHRQQHEVGSVANLHSGINGPTWLPINTIETSSVSVDHSVSIETMIRLYIMWLKQCHKPPMKKCFFVLVPPFDNGDFGDGLLLLKHVLTTLHEHLKRKTYTIDFRSLSCVVHSPTIGEAPSPASWGSTAAEIDIEGMGGSTVER